MRLFDTPLLAAGFYSVHWFLSRKKMGRNKPVWGNDKKMKTSKYPFVTIAISLITVSYSLYVNFEISGSLFAKIKYTELEPYGGVTFNHLWNLEIWRLFASQLIHLNQIHMLFNVLLFAFLGIMLEKHIGSIRFFVLWFVAGVLGSLTSTLTVDPPWNLGTGASQAVFGIAAFGVLILWKKINTSRILTLAVLFQLVPALLLDLIYATTQSRDTSLALLRAGLSDSII